MQKKQAFSQIKKAYSEFEKELKAQGKPPMWKTSHGFWGTAGLDDVFEFFQKVRLEKSKQFMDLGCGDGRVVLVASLFTKASGIDVDEFLVKKAVEIRDKLKLKAEFICDDFFNINLEKYDFIFMFPDNPFSLKFENKFEKELIGSLWTYTKIYEPYFLKKQRMIWVNQVPVSEWKVSIP